MDARTLSTTERVDAGRALEEDGFVIFRDVVSKERLSELAQALFDEFDRATMSGELFEGGGFLSGHLNCFPGEAARFVWDDISRFGIVDLVGELRPDIVESVRATLNFNLPGSVAQHYHMDGLYLKDFLICNVAVVDTDRWSTAPSTCCPARTASSTSSGVRHGAQVQAHDARPAAPG